MHLQPHFAQCALLAAITLANAQLPFEAPDNAVPAPVDFVGFGFETAFMNNFANDFSYNMLNSVSTRLNTPLTIRIGGTSGDRVLFDPSQGETAVCIAGDCPLGSAATYILGPTYFNGFKGFQGFNMTFQAPLGPVLNISNTLAYATQAYDNIGEDRLAAVAIGNEPNLYPIQYRISYTLGQYVNDVKTVMNYISQTLGFYTSGNNIYEVLNLAAGSRPSDLIDAFEDGLNSFGNVKVAALHWYQLQNYCTTLAQQQFYLMNHTITTSLFDSCNSQIDYLNTNDPEVRFVLSETGSGLRSAIAVQGGFGAALWSIDFRLYSLTQGVARVDATQRPAALHSYWVPDNSAGYVNPGPQVRAPWYALPFIADFLGQKPGKVAEVDLGSDTLTAYAIYDANTNAVSKVALLNLRVWVAGESTNNRGLENVSFPLPVNNISYTVRRLQSAAGAQAMGFDYGGPEQSITWAGEEWSYSVDQGRGHSVEGVVPVETYTVTDGEVEVAILDSEAIIINFGGL
ncbi:hypothetical protein N7474_005555 [Penicillium riverlandense]|uniref:uncharacterized protein n=1 Tax=Penicillium riverlandense TaxID=1903569 RepID=UPI00254729F8|nr:uncharacterized protein N7474_005555 [Penicillium riverlandense]KAJ5819964.1 hypothetical protein N7474_005555 [Penicillium riverlandense]